MGRRRKHRGFMPVAAPVAMEANDLPQIEPTYTLERQIAAARSEMGEKRWQELNREWSELIAGDEAADRREAAWERAKELADRNGGLGA